MGELVGIAATPSQSLEYIKGLKSFYFDIAENAVPEHRPVKQKTESVNWDHATKVMISAMKTKKRLECGG